MKKMLRWLDTNFEGFILGIFLVAITLIIFFQILMRYLFNSALPWPKELSRYCFVCSTLLSLSFCMRHKSMMRVDALVSLLPKTAQNIIECFILLISLALYAVLFIFFLDTVSLSRASGQLSTALQVPMHLIYSWGSFSFALAVLRTVQAAFEHVRGMFQTGKEETEI